MIGNGAIDTTRHLLIAVAALAVTTLALTGCTITLHHFALPGDDLRFEVFPGHELEILFETSLYAEDDDLFRLAICQRQPAPPDSVDALTLPFVRLSDLVVSFSGDREPVRPAPENAANESRRRGDRPSDRAAGPAPGGREGAGVGQVACNITG